MYVFAVLLFPIHQCIIRLSQDKDEEYITDESKASPELTVSLRSDNTASQLNDEENTYICAKLYVLYLRQRQGGHPCPSLDP